LEQAVTLLAVVEVQRSAKAGMTADRAAIGGHQRERVQQSIFQTLMIALSVVVLNIFANGVA
jgi:hypothetical protein